MSIIRTGTFTVTATGTAQNVTIGSGMSQPSYFRAVNKTVAITPTNTKVLSVEWVPDYGNGVCGSRVWNATPIDVYTWQASNGLTPFVTSDASLWVPNQAPYTTNKSTNLTITGITTGSTTKITATHSFTSADVGVTWVTISQVVGMTQINTLRGQITAVHSTDYFYVNIDSTNFSAYTSGGIANVITGAPVTTQFGSQVLMTPQYNLGVAGITFGTAVIGTTADVWNWIAEFDTPVNG